MKPDRIHRKKCTHCKGTGSLKQRKGSPALRCQDCDGTGEAQRYVMVFWRYDQFPYVLASRGFLRDNGMAHVPSYAGEVRPAKVLPLGEGAVLWDKLQTLKAEREKVVQALEAGFKSRLIETAPWVLPTSARTLLAQLTAARPISKTG